MSNRPDSADAAERSMLGAIILAPDQMAALRTALAIAPPEIFLHEHNRLTYLALQAVLERDGQADLVTLKTELEFRGQNSKVGGSEYLVTLADLPCTTALPEYARAVRKLAARRKAIAAAQVVTDRLTSGIPLDGTLQELEAANLALMETIADTLPGPQKASDALRDVPDRVEWIFEPLLARGCVTILQGPPKGGKSSFALDLALSTALGSWTSGRFKGPGKPYPALHVAWEDGLIRLKRRLGAYMRGLGIDTLPDTLHLLRGPEGLFFPGGAEVWRRIVDQTFKGEPGVLVLDTLAYTHGADENKAHEMAPVMASIRRLATDLGIAIMLVHHTRKPGSSGDVGGTSERGRGSSAIAAAADTIIDWGRRTAPNVTACSMVSKDADADEWAVRYRAEGDQEGQEAVTWEVEDLIEREDTAQTRERVLETVRLLLQANPEGVTRRAVAQATGLIYMTATRYLASLSGPEGPLEALKGARGSVTYRLKGTDLDIIGR